MYKPYIEMNDLDKALEIIGDEEFPLADVEKNSGISADKLEKYRHDLQSLSKAPWIIVHKIASLYEGYHPMSKFQKVRDPMVGETGWAIRKDGKLYLDNNFYNIHSGSRIILDDDNYTINREATKVVNAEK